MHMSRSVTDTGSSIPSVRPGALSVAAGLLAAIVVAAVADVIIALLARTGGASPAFAPLQPASYVSLTAVGILIGAVGWAVVRRVAKNAAGVLRWLVPGTVVVSFVPDLAVLASGSPGSGPLAVIALMGMHVVVATVAVLAFRRVLPLPAL
jgi:hypothetical protein